MVKLSVGQLSVTGNYRDNNEDSLQVDPQGRFFVVADGMGGQAAGEKASAMAAEIFPRRLAQLINFVNDAGEAVSRGIDKAIEEANAEILALSELDSQFHNMGTTIAFVVASGGKFFVGGVGDSRVYQFRNGTLTQLTKDHSLTQALLDAGTISAEDAATHRFRNVLYRYLGSKEGSSGAEAKEIIPQPGDRYMICSDGVTDGLKDPGIQKVLLTVSDPQKAAEAIVKAALDGGSKDNVTCVVINAD